ncbi:hypothetical protein E2C01_047758 [Portunus trituberculatus]|uniref:Uncharacterized protein n=1 Tax=Portunus trituberculatus TaxID=210409 RepID=A0A5B7G8R0_PORTR|nr:hypothetical protein [Portunus trituberculatus]
MRLQYQTRMDKPPNIEWVSKFAQKMLKKSEIYSEQTTRPSVREVSVGSPSSSADKIQCDSGTRCLRTGHRVGECALGLICGVYDCPTTYLYLLHPSRPDGGNKGNRQDSSLIRIKKHDLEDTTSRIHKHRRLDQAEDRGIPLTIRRVESEAIPQERGTVKFCS